MLAPWSGTENTIKGKVVASPSLGHGESCEFVFAHGLSVHQKCSSYALTNLLFNLCKSMLIIDSLVIRPRPHLRAPAHPFTLEVYEPGNVPQFLVLLLFSPWDSQLSLFWSLGVRHPTRACLFPFEQLIGQQIVQLQDSILERLHHHTLSSMLFDKTFETHCA